MEHEPSFKQFSGFNLCDAPHSRMMNLEEWNMSQASSSSPNSIYAMHHIQG